MSSPTLDVREKMRIGIPLCFLAANILGTRGNIFGPGINIGPTSRGNEIVHSTTIFTPGKVAARPVDLIALWAGLADFQKRTAGDLVQAAFMSYAEMSSWCKGVTKQQWCLNPYVLVKGMAATSRYYIPVNADDKIVVEYASNLTSAGVREWTQILTNATSGKLLATYKRGTGVMPSWQTGTESQKQNKGTAGTQYYRNTTITLREADPTFSRTFRKFGNTSFSGVRSEESGKIWHIDLMVLPPTFPDP